MTHKKRIVILGGGVAGLSAAYYLTQCGKFDVTVLEKEARVGGLCGSFEYQGCVLDYGAHKIYSIIPGVLNEIQGIMGDRLIRLPKKNRIYLRGHLLDYPLKLTNLMKVLGFGTFFKLGLGYAVSLLKGIFQSKPSKTYEDYMVKIFGRPAYQLIFEPLADKVWGDPSELHWEMARIRIPSKGGFDVVLKLLGLKKETQETNAETFYYPKRGFADFSQKLKEDIIRMGGQVVEHVNVLSLTREEKRIVAVEGIVDGNKNIYPCDDIISSIPLDSLNDLCLSASIEGGRDLVRALQSRHLVLVYILLKKDIILNDQWIFFPEKEFIFGRIFEQKQMSPDLIPKEKTVVCCDFTCEEGSWQWAADDTVLIQKCIDGLKQGEFVESGDVLDSFVVRFKDYYPRYDMHYQEKLQKVIEFFKDSTSNLILTGRLGMYNYNNADHCFDMGRFLSQQFEQDVPVEHMWDALQNHVQEYKIVD